MAAHEVWNHPCTLAVLFMTCWTVSDQIINFPPRFRNIQRDTTVSVREDAHQGDIVFNVFASDADGGPLTFTVLNPKGLFEFDEKSLKISEKTQNFPISEFYINLVATGRQPGLDYETVKEHSVTLQVADPQAKSTAVITVKVINANDNYPTLIINQGSVSISEATPIGTSLDYSMTFFDADVNDVVYVGLMGPNANIMNINPSTGQITLNTLIDVDPNNEMKIFTPIVFVSDGKLSSTATLTLTVRDVNDNSPVCYPSKVLGEVLEELPGSRVVCYLNCTDLDSSWSNNNVLNYTIIQGDNSLFSVNSSGAVYALSPLDYEKTKSETVIIKVEDRGFGGRLHTTATVSLAVKPTNDIWPVWSSWTPDVPSDLTYSLYENVPLGTSIVTIAAFDADLDLGNDVTYSMIVTSIGGSQRPDDFSLDHLTGLFSTHSVLDLEGPRGVSQYTILFQASDGVHVINRTVNVVVKDVNDIAPKFVGVPYPTIALREETAKAGSLITKVSATDEDSPSSNLTYTVNAVLSGNTSLSEWKFSPTQLGQLELASDLDLDRDNPPAAVSVLQILVRDNGIPELTGTTTLTVRFIPDNEFSPTVISQPGTVQVPEDTPVRTLITQIEAYDRDKGQEGILVYSITGGNTRQVFSIDSKGWISTQATLDRETLSQYILTVLISDSAENNARSVTLTMTIQVTDVDDNIPNCTPAVQSVAILENSTVNTIVASIFCSNADEGEILTVTVKPPLDSIFGFNAPKSPSKNTTTWELKLLQELDYDLNNESYVVDILVSDGKNTVLDKVIVSLTAVNEVRPSFQTNPSVTLPENVIKSPLFIYQATDLDSSPHDIVSYKINSVSNGGASLFNIESKTGSLHHLSALDFEALPAGDKTYKIVVIAEDGGGLQGTGTVTVIVENVNDNPPVCAHSLFLLRVNEKQNSSGPYNVLSDLQCNDLEDGKNLNYSMTQTPGDHFTITNGSILLKLDSLDYETSQAHTLILKVMDNGTPILNSTVTVYISVINQNDGGPVFSPPTPVSISETAAIGQFLVDVIATDPDGNDPEFGDLQYTIISGDPQSHFFIDALTGQMSTRKKLDFETIPSYKLVIQAKEKKGPNSATVTQLINVIDVNDEKPVCVNTSFVVTVLESKPVNHTVVDLICQDADAGTILIYTITSGDTTHFKMSGSKIKLKAPLDFEISPTSNELTILVSDSITSHELNVSGTVLTGSVDEGPPVFDNASYTVHVLENQELYSKIFTLKAHDPDSSQDENGQVKYTIQPPYSLFGMDVGTGQMYLTGSLDREKEAKHSIVVKAEDALGSNTATVTVVVDDINDNPPRCKYSVYSGAILGTDPAGTIILTVEATDLDDPNFHNYGTVTYQLSGSPHFTINATTGVITNTVRLDTKNGPRIYSLTVTVVDSNGAPGFLSSACVVNVHVTTSNNHAPVFHQPSYSVILQNGQFKIGDNILNVTAQDDDPGPDGEITLNLVSAVNKFNLSQIGNTGQIHLLQNLDFASGDSVFTFKVTATDKGSPAQTGTCIVTILVDDTNDETPFCPRDIYLDKVEGKTFLTRINCSVVDSNRTLTYTVISTTPNNIQPTISNDGELTTLTPLDYESSKSYNILIQVKGNGSPAFVTNITVRLHVIDVNDNDPTFKGPLTFDLPENTTSGSSVLYTVLADSNDDPSDKITFKLLDTTYFFITSDTGEISLVAAAPDYEIVGDNYIVGVCISDSPNPNVRTTCSNITVHIVDCNDESPRFSTKVYQTTVPEDAKVDKSLITVTAFDKDASPKFRNIVYSIKEGNTEGYFRVQSNGTIDLIEKLDYERTQNYTLIVEASDSIHNTTAQCFINVAPVNEHAPVFSVENKTVHVEENVPASTIIFTASATDADGGTDGVVTYRIDRGPFVIDPLSGKVSVIGNLDRESISFYNISIFAVDQGVVAKTGSILVTFIIDDVNDNVPSCDISSYVVSVPESVTPNDTLVALNCMDDDKDPDGLNNALSYTIYSTPADIFSIDQSGHVKLRAGGILDRETEAFYTISITVSDKGTKQRQNITMTLSLVVTDVNDNSPYFTSFHPMVVPENMPPGTIIETIEAVDVDEGRNKQLIYKIADGNPGNLFSLNPTSGDLILSRPLDFESQQQHKLLVSVKDQGSPPRSVTGTLSITVSDINDNPPKCPTTISPITLLENSTNEIVLQVSCDDPDVTGLIVYNITDGNDDNFAINVSTGVVSTKPNAHLDFESVQFYTLAITAFDGVYTDVADFKINIADVNEFPPKFTPPGPINVSVPENAKVNYLIYEFKATDQDSSDSVKVFSIVSGNSAQRFTLDHVTGKLQLQNSLDYENKTVYTLTMAVHDSGGLNDTVQLYINVIDVNDNTPTCQDKSVTVTVPEGVRRNIIYTPSCSDADKKASPILEYSLPTGSHPAFFINNSTGQLNIVEPLDYETDTVIHLSIVVREKGILSPRETSINVHIIVDPVNEFDPVFEPTNNYGPYNIPEDTVTGTVVVQVRASDADKGLSHGTVHYSISSGDPQEYFWMDESNGEIHLTRQLNREAIKEFSLTVTASDSVPGSDIARTVTAKVKMIITDVNDHRPQLIPSLYSLNVSETSNYGPSMKLAHLIVKDEDEGNNSITTIVIASGNNENKFAISDHDLILRDQLDYETTNFFDLLLTIIDNGRPPLKSSGRVRIKILPENEAAPHMEINSADIAIPENSPLRTLVYDANATDTDNEIHGQITYSIEGSTPNEFFINPSSGQLYVIAPLDYDVLPNQYTLVIKATDGAGASDPITSTVSLRITLTDVNDHPPKCSSPIVNMIVSENVALGTQVGVIMATDSDSNENGEVKYNQTGGSGQNFFNVDPKSGIVTTTNKIDYEMFQIFYLYVMAYDGGKPSLISNCLIKLDVTNINDNYPVIIPQNFTVTVPENISVGETVMTYSASDLDTGISSFSLINPSPYFEVNIKSGAVRTKSSLLFVNAKIHKLYIKVQDKPTQADPTVYTSTATLTIMVDSKDHNLVISGDYNTSLPEDTAINNRIFKINATDKNGAHIANLSYSIIYGNIGDAFRIDSQGYVQVARTLDRETVPNYLLTIHVTDKRTPSGEAETQAYIAVIDINDNNPMFSQEKYTFTLAEDSPVGFSVGRLQADDADIGINADLTFEFDFFTVGRMSDFSLHPKSGVITVASSSLNRKINPSYIVNVKVVDAGIPVSSSTALVIININNYSNNEPVFQQATYSVTLNENTAPGTNILQVFAVNENIGNNSEVTYFMDTKVMDGPTAKEYLQVTKTNGIIYTVAIVNYEQYKEFKIVLLATNKGSPALTGSTTVIISIRDINDHNPVFRPKFYNAEVAYNGEGTNSIVTLTAFDEDSEKNAELSYFLQDGAYQDLFEVVPSSGEVKLKSMAVPNTEYKLEIQAQDSGQPIRTSLNPARIRVDTFVPENVIITFRLGISRNAFLLERDKFLEDLEKVAHTKYPTAVVRLWYVAEYDGVAVASTKSFRRLLADMPVDTHVYALRDNSSESEENFDKGKDFLQQNEFLALIADNPEGDPNSNIQGAQWDYLNITDIKSYQKQESSWFAETDGMIITIVVIILGLILLGMILYFILRYCCRSFRKPLNHKKKLKHLNSVEFKKAKKPNTSKVEPEVVKVKPNPDTEMTKPPRKGSFDSDVKGSKVNFQDMMAPSSEIQLVLPRFAVVKLPEKVNEDTPESLLDKSYLRQISDSSLDPQKTQTFGSATDSSVDIKPSSPRAMVITLKPSMNDYSSL